MSDRKLVFLDIDGTLLPKSHRITEKVAQALQQAKDNGHCLCICTGRAYAEVPEEMKKFDGVISAAGACVMWKDEILQVTYLSDEEKEKVAGLLEETDAIYIMEGFEKLYMKKEVRERFFRELAPLQEKGSSHLHYFEQTIPVQAFSEMEKVHKCSFFRAGENGNWFKEKLKKWGMTAAEFSQGDSIGSSGEITRLAYTKGTAVRCLSEYLGIPAEDTIAIGDSENDLEMLKAAGIGIAMGNAPDYVKEAADDVTKSVEEDGIYYAFQKYKLI